MGVRIDYDVVRGAVDQAKATLRGNVEELEGAYNGLLSNFSDSRGEQADTLRSLIEKESSMTVDACNVLEDLARRIEFVTDQLEQLDIRMRQNIQNSQRGGGVVGPRMD